VTMKGVFGAVVVLVMLGVFATLASAGKPIRPTTTTLEDIPPSWHRVLPASERFVLVMPTTADPAGEAVLDKETGLVWEKSPDTTNVVWVAASYLCVKKSVGGRYGWRLPTVEELASLVEPTRTDPALPDTHPFENVEDYYFTATTTASAESGSSNFAYAVGFRGTIGPSVPPGKTIALHYWCVRGGHGYDGFRFTPIP